MMLTLKESCFYLRDLDKARSFYQDILGLPVISYVEHRHIFFRAGAAVFLCFNPDITKSEEVLPAHFAEGNQHVAFEVANKEEYEHWKVKLRAAGISIVHEHTWKNDVYSFYFHDFEQNVIEIVMKGVWE